MKGSTRIVITHRRIFNKKFNERCRAKRFLKLGHLRSESS